MGRGSAGGGALSGTAAPLLVPAVWPGAGVHGVGAGAVGVSVQGVQQEGMVQADSAQIHVCSPSYPQVQPHSLDITPRSRRKSRAQLRIGGGPVEPTSAAASLHARARRPTADTVADEPATRQRGGRPWFEWPARVLAIMIFLVFAWASTFPFFMAMSSHGGEGSIWDTVFDLMDQGEPLTLSLLTLLAAMAGSHAHGKKQPAVSGRTVHLCMHMINIAPLVYTIPWWWPGSFKSAFSNSQMSDLAEGLAYISGVLCRLDMGLCLLPIARASPWLNSAGVAFPEGIPFHRVTGWWCIAQVLIHSLAEIGAVASEGYAGDETPAMHNSTKWDRAMAAIPVFIFPWVERLDDETGMQELNTEGLVNFCGLLGTVAATVILFSALPPVRRNFYHIFYNAHVPAAAIFIIMAAFHNFPMQVSWIIIFLSAASNSLGCL